MRIAAEESPMDGPTNAGDGDERVRLRRRDFLRTSALAGAGAVAGGTLLGRSAEALAGGRKEYKTKHVILVAFAGGVRARDCIGSPDNITSMSAIAEKGVVLSSVRAANLGHYGAALALFTGCPEARGIRENGRGEVPTIFEYLRKDAGLSAADVWLSTTAGAQTRNFAYSTNKNYGAEYGANLISTDGLFNAEFRDLIGKFGNASLPGEKETKQVKRLVGALDDRFIEGAVGGGIGNDAETSLRIQRYILEELRGDTARITGPGSGDAKSIRVANNLMRLFRPKLIQQLRRGHSPQRQGDREAVAVGPGGPGAARHHVDLHPSGVRPRRHAERAQRSRPRRRLRRSAQALHDCGRPRLQAGQDDHEGRQLVRRLPHDRGTARDEGARRARQGAASDLRVAAA